MNRIDRLSAILIQLQTKRVVTAKEIAGRFHISIRTVYRDIRSLEAAGIPISSDAGLGYYLVEGYHLPPVMFTAEEAGALIVAGKLTEQFSDGEIRQQYDSALYKIKSVLKDRDKDYLERLQSHMAVYRMAEEMRNPGSGHIKEIQAALGGKKVLDIKYRTAGNPESTFRTIEPVSLGFYDYHWHLIAYCRLRKEYRDFRIDRIEELDVTNEVFCKDHPPVRTLMDKMLEKKDLQQVTIRFRNNSSYEIIKNKCILGFVEEKDLGDKIEMTLLMDSLPVLGRWLLQYADDVEIVSPPELKQIIHKYIEEIAKRFR